MHRNAGILFNEHARPLFKPSMKVLEVGPDGAPSSFQKSVGLDSIVWHTLDISAATNPTFVAKSEYEFPLAEGAYDIVVSGNVLEHVKKIWVWMAELARVCKKDGHVVTLNPLSWPFHEYPADCWRIYPDGMRALYEAARLKVVFCSCENRELDETNPWKIEDYTSNPRSRGGNFYPGIGMPPRGFKSALKRALCWPMPLSFDTVTIGVKE